MCGRTVLPFLIDEPILEIDYVENLPVVEEALARLTADEPRAGDQPRQALPRLA